MVAVKRTRGGTQPAPLSRGEILDVAMPLLAEHGIDGLTVRAVADAVGTTSPALYHYFASRDDLLDRLCERVMREVDLSFDRNVPWDDAVVRVILNMHRTFARYPGVAARVLPVRSSPAADRVSATVYDIIRAAGYEPATAEELLAALQMIFGGWLAGKRANLPGDPSDPALLERVVRWTISGFVSTVNTQTR